MRARERAKDKGCMCVREGDLNRVREGEGEREYVCVRVR